MGNAIVKLVKKVKKLEGFLKRRNLVLTESEDEEPEAQGRKSQADPQDSSIQGLVTPPTTKAHASGEEQVEDISPNTLEAAKTLSKVASLKSRSIDKGRRYKRRKETKILKLILSSKVNTGSIELNTVLTRIRLCKENGGSCKINTNTMFAEERAKAKRNKPMTQSQLKTYMMNYLKNQGSWKINQLKKLSFAEVKEEFDKLVKQIESFAPISFEATKASLKRFSEELQTKTPKRKMMNSKRMNQQTEVWKEEKQMAKEREKISISAEVMVKQSENEAFGWKMSEDCLWAISLISFLLRIHQRIVWGQKPAGTSDLVRVLIPSEGYNHPDHIPPLPAISPFLSSDDDTTDSDTPEYTNHQPTQWNPFSLRLPLLTTEITYIPRRRVMILSPGQPIPHGRPFDNRGIINLHANASSDSSREQNYPLCRDALRDRGIDARVVVEAIDRDEIETGVRGPVEVRVERGKMPSTRSGAPITHEEFEEIVTRRVAEEMEARESARTLEPLNKNGDELEGENGGNGNRNGNHGMNYEGTEGVVGLTRWVEKMETVFNISNCPPKYQVKYATCTLHESALTWWKSHKRTIGVDAAYVMNWAGLMRLMTEVYCPRNEIQKMKNELWNLTVKGNDLTAYTQRFQELILLYTRMVPNEEDRVERFIRGLPDNIQGNVIAIRIANQLMDKKVQGYAARSAENKRRMESNLRDNRGQQPPFKRQNTSGQNVAKAYTAGNNERKGYAGPLTYCNKYRLHHEGLCTMMLETRKVSVTSKVVISLSRS
ncbi:putative reverse transcriptase domain-containing protein [Tanacetum coccineum]